jgi:hypothetical protein
MVTFGSVQGSSFSPVALGVMRALNESHSIESSAHQLPCLFVPSLTSSRLQAYVCSGIHHLRWRKSCEITKAIPGWLRKVGIAVVRRYIFVGNAECHSIATNLMIAAHLQNMAGRCRHAIGVQQRLMCHADIRTTMNIYGDAVTKDMLQARSKIVRLALPTVLNGL